MHKIIYIILLALAGCIAIGCQSDENTPDEGTGDDQPALDLATIPGMVTEDVSMLVSDSGVIRYHVIAKWWYRYNLDSKDPYWYFPEGLELHQLNNARQPVGNVVADTAYHYERQQKWHLTRNVHISNVRGEKFDTEDLYWDMREHKVWSDSFIHIERNHDILEGYGFTSNEDFTEYEVRQTTGIFGMRHKGEAEGNATAEGDVITDAPDDGEHLAENDEPGTLSPTMDTLPAKPLTPKEKAEAARERRNNRKPQALKLKDVYR